MNDSFNNKKAYHRSWYINKRDYIISLTKIPRSELDNFQQFDLDKHIKRFGPRINKPLMDTSAINKNGSDLLKKVTGYFVIDFN